MSNQNPNGARLADFLPYQLSVTSNAVSSRISEQYRTRFGLKITEWRIMAVLGDSGAATQRDLASLTVMDKVAVNRACKILQERGLLERRPNAQDGRSHHLALTDEGRAIHDEVMPLAKAMEREVFSSLDKGERELFREFLARLLAQATRM